MKKLLVGTLITAAVMMFLCGCTQSKAVSKAESKAEPIKETEEVIIEEVAKEEVNVQEKEEPIEDTRSEAQKFAAQINVGWNLGNTLDAHGCGNSVSAETYWGNPKTTQEMIDAVAAKGFNTIRIPVTFAEHLGPAPDYTIDPAWLDRVEEVVNYGINDNMFVILDTHHETDYWLSPEEDKEAVITEELVAIWKQLCERFKDYDNHLIFEGMNEPRVKGSAQEWTGGLPAQRAVVDRMNQAFVDTVREGAGNNPERYVIICTYANTASDITIRNLVLPDDDHLIVSVHMYTPYEFTYPQSGKDLATWDGSKLSDITTLMKTLKVYIYNKKIPVIITEFGAVNKNNDDDVAAWVKDFMAAANEYEFKVVWWDNGLYNTGNEHFAIFNRNDLSWYRPKVADALIANSITS